jgi:hypothetical protein
MCHCVGHWNKHNAQGADVVLFCTAIKQWGYFRLYIKGIHVDKSQWQQTQKPQTRETNTFSAGLSSPSTPRSSMQSFSFRFSNHDPDCISILYHACHTPYPSHPPQFHQYYLWSMTTKLNTFCTGVCLKTEDSRSVTYLHNTRTHAHAHTHTHTHTL